MAVMNNDHNYCAFGENYYYDENGFINIIIIVDINQSVVNIIVSWLLKYIDHYLVYLFSNLPIQNK